MSASTPRFVDLSHPVVGGEAGYPGLPAPRIEPYISHAASRASYGELAEFEITRLFLVGNSGTYLDSPAHRFAGAADVAALPISVLAGLPGIVVDVPTSPTDRSAEVALPPAFAGHAVLLRTGWDARRGTRAYWEPAPYVSSALAARLVDGGAALVGTDAWNVDDTADPARPAHTRLLRAGIPIVEHLANLGALPAAGFRLFAVPAPVRGATSLPVRAFAELGGTGGI